jgi:hypothetical protein
VKVLGGLCDDEKECSGVGDLVDWGVVLRFSWNGDSNRNNHTGRS